MSSKPRIAVIRGGAPEGYDSSLEAGGHVLAVLGEMPEKYKPIDIFVSKEGEWHREGLVHEPHRALGHVDIAWNLIPLRNENGLHARRLLENLKIPSVGSGLAASVLAGNRDAVKRLYRENSILSPAHMLIDDRDFSEDRLVTIFRTQIPPFVIKPAKIGQSLGSKLAYTFQELKESVKKAFTHSPQVAVEEFIKGVKVTSAVVEGARGEKLYTFTPVVHQEEGVVSLDTERNKLIEELARKAHDILGLKHFSNSHFLVTPKGKIYILKTDHEYPFHEESYPKDSLKSLGWRYRDLVGHLVDLAH